MTTREDAPGIGGFVRLARMSDQPLDAAEVERAVTGPHYGAVVVFSGVVRDNDSGRHVSALEYSAHPEAQRFLHRCCTEVAEATGLPVATVHRTGALTIGDLAIVAAVAAQHRGEAFDACERLVDRVKHEVPIWKRQLFTDGLSEWVNACG